MSQRVGIVWIRKLDIVVVFMRKVVTVFLTSIRFEVVLAIEECNSTLYHAERLTMASYRRN